MPYHVEYRHTLLVAAAELSRAAAATGEPSLRRFLERRAAAFLSSDYYDSDVAWMELDSAVEPTIGPYETYEDGWFGYKAAFEAFITVRDAVETDKLGGLGRELQRLEDTLPIDARYRNPALGGLSPIRVVNLVFAAGDGNRGVQTAAFNLPNDERVLREKGAKRVMLKNVQEAKFQPRARAHRAPRALGRRCCARVLRRVLRAHPPPRTHARARPASGRARRGVPVRLALKDTYAAIEEAKADISGLWALQDLVDRGVVAASIASSMYVTFLASMFRSIRFGLNEAHGRGIALQLNTLLDDGAVGVGADGTFGVDAEVMRRSIATLTRRIMTIQAEGDYAAAAALLDRMVTIRPDVQRCLDAIADIPVDIAPDFTTARALEEEARG